MQKIKNKLCQKWLKLKKVKKYYNLQKLKVKDKLHKILKNKLNKNN